jgi:hypothetical protein
MLSLLDPQGGDADQVLEACPILLDPLITRIIYKRDEVSPRGWLEGGAYLGRLQDFPGDEWFQQNGTARIRSLKMCSQL